MPDSLQHKAYDTAFAVLMRDLYCVVYRILRLLFVECPMRHRQTLVGATDMRGRFVCINRLSRAAQGAGMTRSNVVGRALWEFSKPKDAVLIQRQFADCLLHTSEPQYVIESEVSGVKESWRCLLLPASGAEVVMFAEEIIGVNIVWSADDLVLLRSLADDRSIEEIATDSHLPASTVASRVKRLRDRAGTQTNHGLIASCFRSGAI